MLLSITTTHTPATDLGYLLHKHPDKIQNFEITGGTAYVMYPEATEERCTCALIVDIDPIALVRGKPGSKNAGLVRDYVNDRPYTANSITASAMSDVFRSALNGRCVAREALVQTPIDLKASIASVRLSAGVERIERLWSALGYDTTVEPLDGNAEEAKYGKITIASSKHTLAQMLSQMSVLIPAIDGRKHHFVSASDIEVLVRRGQDWLGEHPDREWVSRRFLNRQQTLAEAALERLVPEEADEDSETGEARAQSHTLRVPLQKARIEAVRARLLERGATRIVDVGCGEGDLIRALVKEPQVVEVIGVDASTTALERAERRVRRLPEQHKNKMKFVHAPAGAIDERWSQCDAIAVVETIEHIDPENWEPVERCIFEIARPKTVVVTTPNREYNPVYGIAPDKRRHRDHRFEWTREEMRTWCENTAKRYGYEVEVEGIGTIDPEHGSPTLMGVFAR